MGAFYTPKFISDYISKRALCWYFKPSLEGSNSETAEGFDDLLQGKNDTFFSDPVRKGRLKEQLSQLVILDPSAGSGIFLLSCAELLEKIYIQLNPVGQNSKCKTKTGDLRLKIIQQHLFGWDIDPNAVQILHNVFQKWIENLDITPFLNQISIPHSELTTISDLPSNFTPNFVNQDGLEMENWFQPEKSVIIIGNPPFGNILSIPRKKELSKRYICRPNEISELFVELGSRLIEKHNMGILSFILPKTITYYQKWELCRNLIIQHDLLEIHDLGIAFNGVNLEQIAIIGRSQRNLDGNLGDFQPSINLVKYLPLKTPNKTVIVQNGTVPRTLVKTSKMLIISPLTERQTDILVRIKEKCIFLDELGKITRSLYISDQEKTTLKSGKILFLNKIPDLNAFSIKKLYAIQKKTDYNEFLKPKIIFKVLRGSRLSTFPDKEGLLFTTEKAVNVLLSEKWQKHAYALCLFLNSRIPSFFIQATLYSQTTETSRVMDPYYAKRIPIPIYQQDLYDLADDICKMLIIAHSLGFFDIFQKFVHIGEALALLAFFRTDIDRFRLNELNSQIFALKTQKKFTKLKEWMKIDHFDGNLQSIFKAIYQQPPIQKDSPVNKNQISLTNPIVEWSQIEGILDQIYKDLRIYAIEESWIYQEIYQLLGK